MFIFFQQNKLSSDKKGQFVPIFIVVLVALIIMALVTVNLSKVALFKTESSNAADAGALAAGSVMANVFNAVAQASSEMEAAYWEFFVMVSASFALALTLLISGKVALTASSAAAEAAIASACAEPCSAAAEATVAKTKEELAREIITRAFVATVMGIMVAITAYSIASYYHYRMIKDMAEEGRNSAIQIGYQFAFMNSGIGAKLKSGNPDDASGGDANNYRDTFSKFLDEISETETPQNEYTYAWKDGQDRQHSVRVKITINPVDEFEVRTTFLPWPAELALLGVGTNVLIMFSYAAATALAWGACHCRNCCGPWAPPCCACWWLLCGMAEAMLNAGLALNLIAITETAYVAVALLAAWAGLLPGPTTTNPSFFSTICWIEDIVHDRRVKVETWQSHEGAELGTLWKTSYPALYTFSVVDFTGHGKIHPPKLRHDASIIATDQIGAVEPTVDPYKECPAAQELAAGMEKDIAETLADAKAYDAEAENFESIIRTFRLEGMPQDKIDEVIKSAADARALATETRQEAADLEAALAAYKASYPSCF
ncbi:MAG: pilus assembly protein TadG-related protein [Candidatus Omnitrophota bacterium]|jgi:hypothetical protein